MVAKIVVEGRAAAAVRRGHPWVYRDALRAPKGAAPRTGDAVSLVDERDEPLGAGLFDAGSPIAVRVHAPPPASAVSPRDIAAAVLRAARRREPLFASGDTTAARLCHGEGDRVPGFVLDRYAGVGVVRLDGDAIARHAEAVVEIAAPELEALGVRTLVLRDPSATEGATKIRALRGPAPPSTLDVVEHGMIMEVDIVHGQKTGAFLDQRENRRRVRDLCRQGWRVLNLFSYTGGFSVAAALGGAAEVTSVDLAAKAHAAAQRTFSKNGVDPARHRFVTADAIAHAEELGRRGERFDLVISDPPSFARSEKAVGRALSTYTRLHRACAALLAPGGTLCASSCSSHVSLDRFLGTLDDAAIVRADLVVRAAYGAGDDHPTLAAFPEGRYLKFVVMG